MILETEKTLTSLVPMEEIALPEEDIQGEGVPRGVNDKEETLPGGAPQGEALQMIRTTVIQVRMTKMRSLRITSGEIPPNIPTRMGSEPDVTI